MLHYTIELGATLFFPKSYHSVGNIRECNNFLIDNLKVLYLILISTHALAPNLLALNSRESSPSSDGSHSQQQTVPVDVSLENHADYSSELFSSSGTTANDSVIFVCSNSSSSQLKEPEEVYGPDKNT